MRTTKAQRDLLAVTVAADLASTFLQPGSAGPSLTVEGTRNIILSQVGTQAVMNDIHEKHINDMQMQAVAGDFFDQYFGPLYDLYFKAPSGPA